MNTYYLGLDLNLPQSIKILKVKKALGFSGFGLYVELLLKLAQSPNYELSISDYELLAYEFRLDVKYIKNLVENFDLFVVEKSKFFCPDVKQKMLTLEAKRKASSEAGKLGNAIRWGKLSGGDNTTTSGSDRKPNRNKGNKEKKINKDNKEKIINDFFDDFENVKKLVLENKVKPNHSYEWHTDQAKATINRIKENMLAYYVEANKKEIKDIKRTFINWLAKTDLKDFYRYKQIQVIQDEPFYPPKFNPTRQSVPEHILTSTADEKPLKLTENDLKQINEIKIQLDNDNFDFSKLPRMSLRIIRNITNNEKKANLIFGMLKS